MRAHQLKIEKGEIPVIGVNIFTKPEEPRIEILRVDPTVRKKVIERLNNLKKSRDQVKVQRTLNNIRKVAEKEEKNIFPCILEAIRSKATLGEISNVLREVWSEWKAPEVF